MYDSNEYQEVAEAHRQILDQTELSELSGQRIGALSATFGSATRLEIDFWQMGLDII